MGSSTSMLAKKMNTKEQLIFDLVRAELTEDMIPKSYQGLVDSPMCGHCHHATLAMYDLLGGKDEKYKVKKGIDEDEISHYWLQGPTGEIIDPTHEQYTDLNRTAPYQNPEPRASYRKTNAAKSIIDNVSQKLKEANKAVVDNSVRASLHATL